MLFFSLAENTNFSAQSRGIAEGIEFTISLFTIMALTFQRNEHHWVPSDKSAGLAATANYLVGRKGCVPGMPRRVCELWRMGKEGTLVFVSCKLENGPHWIVCDLYLFSTTEQIFLPIMIPNTLKSTLGHWRLQGRSNASGIIPYPGQRGRVNKALLCVANRCLC